MTGASVVIPAEHGGWSLTLEPVVLGLIVAPSATGFLLGLVAFGAFVVRTPLKVVLVDRRRGRHLDRTTRAAWFVGIEATMIVTALAAAVLLSERAWWWPVLAAVPLVAVATWFDARSRSRRIVPELAGTIGIGAAAAAISLAGGASDAIAGGLWAIIIARDVASVFYVRIQLRRLKAQLHQVWHSDGAQVAGFLVAVAAVAWLDIPAAGLIAIALVGVCQTLFVRMQPQRAAVLGSQQIALGLVVVLVTGLAVRAP